VEKAARKYGPSVRDLTPARTPSTADVRGMAPFERNDDARARKRPSQFVCADPGCVAFDVPHRMYLVLPRPLAELGNDADDVIRHSVRCESCYMRRANALEGRALALFYDRTGTVQDALHHPLLSAALLSGDPMSPDSVRPRRKTPESREQ